MSTLSEIGIRQFCRVFRVTWFVALLFLAAAAPPSSGREVSDDDIRLAFRSHLSSKASPTDLRQTALPLPAVRTLLIENLGLRKSSIPAAVSGTEWRFSKAGEPTEVQTGLLLLAFRSENLAQRAVARLARLKGYFKGTKILTRFSTTTVGQRVAIAYTENAGDARLVEWIDEFPSVFTVRVDADTRKSGGK